MTSPQGVRALRECVPPGESRTTRRGSVMSQSKPQETAVYTHGHHESVLRSHTWRTAANSAAYLLGSLKPHMQILDIGCGPGTITADLAELVPDGRVTAVDHAPGILDQA